ncbi:FIG00860065: hypothetical protein [hydrothermal vent metagenome]|uniref:Uncharacterized protein n=1 Tax=hydrothermal vent metagenome TaxID=652676 RepID=A0A3B1AUH2_9ZZZZ
MGLKKRVMQGMAATSLFLILILPPVAASQACDTTAAHMISVEGVIESKPPAGTTWQQLQLNSPICNNDIVRTGPNSRGGILIGGSDTIIRLDQTTTFQIVIQPQEKEQTILDIISGAIHFISRVRHNLRVRTPFINAAMEGTEFTVQVGLDKASVALHEGVILASNDAGILRLAPNQVATAERGQAPQLDALVQPEDAVQWALHYQPIMYGLIDLAKIAAEDPQFHNYQAGMFLLVGRVEEAQRELQQSLRKVPDNSTALALQAMIAVAQNRKDQALELANRAEAADGSSAVPLIALSYAQQAKFDIHGALDSIELAVLREPDNPYAHARLAELHLMVGDLDMAMTAAQATVALDAKIALTQTVLGFAHLTRIEITQAKESFQTAIALDQADPLPRLGLGLALIRQGDLDQGRRELEIATVLSPNNALVRSYMGKAYYEEHRDELAATQYDIAKERDPQDPTPWYYHALLLHQQGRTVEALTSLQTSAELNDNRAVYRSKLLLDQDQAARSAGLGRIYRDLNFEQLALIEGWKSLGADPADHSGHRLLADTYTNLPRHEVARVSELLQSQLLQPVNNTPIRPIMAEATRYIPDGMGPSDPSFNEYSTLFNQDGLRAYVSAVGGSNDIAGGEVLLSGMKGSASFSLGQYRYETDGWWDNNDLEQDIYVGFLQLDLSHNTSVQIEARRSQKEYGDLSMHFYEADYDASERNTDDFDSLRFGFHHRFNPRSEVIASLMFGDRKTTRYTEPSSVAVGKGEADADSRSIEVRHLMRWDSVRATIGAGYLEDKEHRDILTTLTIPVPCFLLPPPTPPTTNLATAGGCIASTPTETNDTYRNANGYIYASIDLGPELTLDLGVSYDDYSEAGFAKEQLNPKLGLTWQMGPDTTFRAAGFRTLKRPLVTSQTIEPTQVAGFNQFFDGTNGEQAERYGIALDHRFSQMLFSGVELSHRREKYPRAGTSWALEEAEQARTYFYLMPMSQLALSVEHFYERVHAMSLINTTHRFPLSFSYFHQSGLSGSLRPTFVRQYGQFDAGEGNDRERFWNFDFSLGYRLPQRMGRISLDVRNLLDDEFGYQPNDDKLPLFVGDRTVSIRAYLDF